MSAKEQVKKEIIEAYVFLRTNNMTIPSETLEFMKDSSLEALDQALILPDVSQQRELLLAYEKSQYDTTWWMSEGEITNRINDFLANNCG